METTVFELNARAHNQVFDGAGDKEFARVRERGDSMGDDHCETCDVLVSELDLSGMNAGAHLETPLPTAVEVMGLEPHDFYVANVTRASQRPGFDHRGWSVAFE